MKSRSIKDDNMLFGQKGTQTLFQPRIEIFGLAAPLNQLPCRESIFKTRPKKRRCSTALTRNQTEHSFTSRAITVMSMALLLKTALISIDDRFPRTLHLGEFLKVDLSFFRASLLIPECLFFRVMLSCLKA